VDGVRMNTTIFRSGNVQNIISIDPNSIENTEIIFGPSSQLYGSDAIGGVMSFTTLKPSFGKSDSAIYSGGVNLRYSSASNERSWSTHYGYGSAKLATLTNLSFSSFKDLKMGKNGPDTYNRPDYVIRLNDLDSIVSNSSELDQVFTGYNQVSFLQKVAYKINPDLLLSYGLHFSTTSDIPRYDRLIQREDNDTLINGDWYYGPQSWLMNRISLKSIKETGAYDSFNIVTAHQRFKESRNTRKLFSEILTTRTEEVSAYSLNADFTKTSKQKIVLNYGLEYVFNKVSSDAYTLNIMDVSLSPTSTRYPDGSSWQSSGAYFNIFKKWKKWYNTEGGLRYSRVSTKGNIDTTYQPIPVPNFDIDNQAITGSISQLFKLKKGSIGLITSTAFRSPNIDDISKVFDSNTGYVTVPNTSLKPEYAYNAEVNLNYELTKNLKINSSFFYTYLDNAIRLENSTLSGNDSIVYDNVLSQVQTLTNSDFAEVKGVQLMLLYNINKHLELKSNYTILQSGSNSSEPIRHITPDFGGTTITYSTEKWNASIYAIYNQKFQSSRFTKLETERAYLYTLNSDGDPYSPSWVTANLRFDYQIKKGMHVNLGIENILNKKYRPYAYRITSPGRNISVSFRASL
ncbi:MAG: TonB-dependent receptor plug domain-containing protein, partial [Bacteroidia bacterium]